MKAISLLGMDSTRDLRWSMSSILHGEGPQLRDFPLQSWQVVGFWILHLVFHQEPEILNFNFHFPLLLPLWYRTARMRSLLYYPRQKVVIRMQRNFLCNIPRHTATHRKKTAGRCDTQGWCNYDIYRAQFRWRALYKLAWQSKLPMTYEYVSLRKKP